MRRPKSKKFKLQSRETEVREIELLESWIGSGKPDPGSNPLACPPLPDKSSIGRLPDGSFSPYLGAVRFSQLPLSKKTKDGLAQSKYVKMTYVQRAVLPHALCGRNIIGAAKTGSGKTLAFVIPVLEKLYKARWGPEDGVGCIIMSPGRELAGQIFDVLKAVGKHHSFSAGLLIGGLNEVHEEKERVNMLNILVCTPGRLKEHMDGTPNFDCSQLQVLVLDEADGILEKGFEVQVDAIISQLPKHRQTLLFSATQTKSAKDLARLNLKNAEYIGVHDDSATATPNGLKQTAMIVPLDHKLDMLWSFLKAHLGSRILVFLSSCKQVKFVFEVFKKLRPGVPLKCLHGRMKQAKRMGIYEQFCQKESVLFATDVAARGLDFDKAVDWVVQVDCPNDVPSYIHRVGRTARHKCIGKSILFLDPSEAKMLDKLHERNVPIDLIKENTKKFQPVSGLLAALLVKYPNLQQLAQRAFVTYLRSIYKQKDKEVFDVMKLQLDEFSASLGLPMTPKIRFLKQNVRGKKAFEELHLVPESAAKENPIKLSEGSLDIGENVAAAQAEDGFLVEKDTLYAGEEAIADLRNDVPATRILKKKKLKINVHRPVGKRVVFDEEGNTLPPFAKLADSGNGANSLQLDVDKVLQRYAGLREEMKEVDKVDKVLDRHRRMERRIKQKIKWKRGREDGDGEAENDEDLYGSDREMIGGRANKKTKIYCDGDNEDNKMRKGKDDAAGVDAITLAEQEALALKLLSSMHS